jgi:uncharacterized protein (TIGR04222 family)
VNTGSNVVAYAVSIPAPLFLGIYAIAAVGTTWGVWRVRAYVWRTSNVDQDFDPTAVHPCDLALLRGRELAVGVGLVTLTARGAVRIDARQGLVLQEAGPGETRGGQKRVIDATAVTTGVLTSSGPMVGHPIEQELVAVLAARGATPPNRLRTVVCDLPVVSEARARASQRWVPDAATRRRLQWTNLLWVPVVALVAAWCATASDVGAAFGPLALALLATLFVATFIDSRPDYAPALTSWVRDVRRGRIAWRDADPEHECSAMELALFGSEVLARHEPGLVQSLGLPRSAAAGWSGIVPLVTTSSDGAARGWTPTPGGAA